MKEGQTQDEKHSGSPPWAASTKRVVQTILLVLVLLLLYRVRVLLFPLVISLIVAYALNPLVDSLYKETRLSRNLALAFVYLLIIGGLVAVPVGTIPRIVGQISLFIQNLPDYLVAFGDFLSKPIEVGAFTIPLNELRLEQIYDTISGNLIDIIRSIGSSSVILFGSLASITLSTVGWLLVILFISFYMVKDHQQLLASLVQLAPPEHRPDVHRLIHELSDLWNDFFRSRIVLCFIVGLITFVLAVIIELPNALVLSLIAGVGEFVPNIGPTLASLPAMLVAALQHDSSWLGTMTGPFWYVLIVLGIYILIQQIENNFLVPRIIGQTLNMHPMVVFIAALAGASVGGVLGILLAAPVLASGRLLFVYIYRKLNDLPPFPQFETLTTELETLTATSHIENNVP
jgi:predicted PurR-regulated permease PerM